MSTCKQCGGQETVCSQCGRGAKGDPEKEYRCEWTYNMGRVVPCPTCSKEPGLRTQYGVLVHEENPEAWVTREHAFRCAQNVARGKGYAVALHGSQIKDIDLLAVPWTEDAAKTSPHTLAALIAYSLPGVLERDKDGEAGTNKPHRRIAFTIRPYITYGADHWYIDLSVIPPVTDG